jgi:hypothetical protein
MQYLGNRWKITAGNMARKMTPGGTVDLLMRADDKAATFLAWERSECVHKRYAV